MHAGARGHTRRIFASFAPAYDARFELARIKPAPLTVDQRPDERCGAAATARREDVVADAHTLDVAG
jgi:hypothetical protein